MAKKRGKLTGKAKKKFLARMARGRRKAAGGGKVRRRRPKKSRGKRNPAHKVLRRRKRRAKSNPAVTPRRRRRGRRSAKRNPSPVRRRRRRGKRNPSNALVRRLSAEIGRLTGGQNRKRRKRGRHSGIGVTARKMALQARRRVARGGPGVSAKARAYIKIHGLNKVNPSMSGVWASLNAIPRAVPELLIGVGALGGSTALGHWLGGKLVAKYGASWAKVAPAGISLVSGILGFLGLSMTKASSYRMAVLSGGVGGAFINLLAENHAAPAPGSTVALSWGRVLQLPIGSVVPRSSTVGDFDPRQRQRGVGEVITREVSVNAMGEVIPRYLAVGESTEAQLDRLLGELELQNDSASGF